MRGFEVRGLHVIDPGTATPVRDIDAGKSEPAVSELLAHVPMVVFGEVDDEQPTPWAKGPSSFGDGRPWIVEEVEHMMQDDHVDGGRLEVESVGIALTDGAVGEVVQPAAGHVEHLGAQVDADSEADPRREQFEDPSGTRPDIEQGVNVEVLDGAEERVLEVLVGDVEIAERIPVIGDALEVGGSGFGPSGPHHRETVEVTLYCGVIEIDERQHGIEEVPPDAHMSGAIEDAGALGLTVEQAGFGQQTKVSTDARLALAQNPTQLTDRELTLGQDDEGSQPRRLGGGSKGGKQIIHWLNT